MILQAKNQLTLQEFLNLSPGEGDITYELVDGQAIPKMSPKFFHAKLTRVLLNLIEQSCEFSRDESLPYVSSQAATQELE